MADNVKMGDCPIVSTYILFERECNVLRALAPMIYEIENLLTPVAVAKPLTSLRARSSIVFFWQILDKSINISLTEGHDWHTFGRGGDRGYWSSNAALLLVRKHR